MRWPVKVSRLIILVLDGELEHIGALQNQRRDAIRPQQRATGIQTVGIFILIFGNDLLALFLLFLLCFKICEGVLLGNCFAIADRGNHTILDEHGTSAIPLDGTHIVRDQNHGLRRILLDFREIVVALPLEGLIANGQDLIRTKMSP